MKQRKANRRTQNFFVTNKYLLNYRNFFLVATSDAKLKKDRARVALAFGNKIALTADYVSIEATS